MANNEDYLDALIAYSKNPSREIPTVLEQYLNGVAKNGETIFQWQLLKPLIVGKMDQVIEELRQKQSSEIPNGEKVLFDVMHTRIMDAVHRFNGAPFTIQRLCELLIDPKQHYKRSDKFMRGLEKNVLVVSTVDPFGRKIVSESNTKHLFNGADLNASPFLPLDSNISSNLPPVPDWVMTTVSKTSPQHTFPADSSEQKPTQKLSQNVSTDVSAVRLMNSDYPDHGEESSVEQLEEVIEESVVIMDTNEAGTVATDGGEAMAEEDVEEEEMGEGINCASSSTEELLTPAANENSLAEMTRVTSSSDNLAKPLADISEEENLTRKSTCFSTVTDSSPKSEKLFEFFSQASSDNLKTFSSYFEVSSNRTDHSQSINDSLTESSSPVLSLELKSSHIDQSHDINDSLKESAPDLSVQQKTLDNRLNIHPCTAAMIDTMVSQDDPLCDVSESNNANNINKLEFNSDNSASGSNEFTPTSSVVDNPGHVEPHQTPSSPVHSYTDVSASLTTDPMSKNNVDLNSAEECDSVTSREIIDNAAEATTSQMSSTVPSCTPSPTEIVQRNQDELDATLLSSSCDSCIDSEELPTEHSRLSDEAPSPSISSMVSIVTPLEMTVSSSSDTSVSSDMIANTTSDSTSKLSALASLDQTYEFLDTVSCSEKDTDFPANVSDIIQERVTEPSPHLSPSDILHTNMTEQEEILTQEATEVTTLIPECLYKQEPMEQD